MFLPRPFAARPRAKRWLLSPGSLSRLNRADVEATIRALCANAYLGNGTALCRVLGRFKLFVDTSDVGVSTHLLLDGYWEMWLTELLATLVKPEMIVIDVGANLGYYSVLMGELVGTRGTVHAFEPNPHLAGLLWKSAQANGYSNWIKLHQTALGSDAATARLIVPRGEPKNGHLSFAEVEPGSDDCFEVEVRRLDSYAELLDADIVKVDAEGAEWDIWRGMRGIFDRGRAMCICLEFNGLRYNDPAAFLSEIAEEGFDFGLLDLSDGVMPVTTSDLLSSSDREDKLLVLRR